MAIKFITGNNNKFKEAQAVLAPLELERVDIDLAEIQEVDPQAIIRHKLREAFQHHSGEFMVEDSSLFLECFDYKLPGPLIKWFNDTIGTQGIWNLANKMGWYGARAQTIIGYAKSADDIQFFEGHLNGSIHAPEGDYPFGYDPIFVPEGSTKTLGQMKAESNFGFSPRGLAVQKLKEFLLSEREPA